MNTTIYSLVQQLPFASLVYVTLFVHNIYITYIIGFTTFKIFDTLRIKQWTMGDNVNAGLDLLHNENGRGNEKKKAKRTKEAGRKGKKDEGIVSRVREGRRDVVVVRRVSVIEVDGRGVEKRWRRDEGRQRLCGSRR